MSTSTQAHDDRFSDAFGIVRDAIATRAFPGAALAVTLQGELIACRGFGRFTYEPASAEISPNTIFDLASLTKVLATAPMAMLLYERGQLDLDVPVATIIPEFRGSETSRERVTARMLLAHTSGLPAYLPLFEWAHTRENLLLSACRTRLEAAPGEHTEYSDIGFIILGEALERVSGEPLERFSQREIFGPLGMARTCFNPPASIRAQIPPTEQDRKFRNRIIQGEVNDENGSVMGGISGHAGLFAPAADVARFAECMLRQGRPILRPNTIELFTAAVPSRSGNARALGWDLPSAPSQSGLYFSPRSFGHLGFTGTSLWIDPERQLSVTLLTNRTWPDRRSQEIKRIRPAFHDAVMQALSSLF